MFNVNQLVEMQWANKTRKHYEAKGYAFTKYGDSFYVKAEDLTYSAKARVEVVCDFCGKSYYPKYSDFNKRTDKSIDSCDDCKVLKQWTKTRNKRAKEKFDIVKEICFDNDYELITDESEFIGVLTPIAYICKKHGVQKQLLDNVIRGCRCACCSYEERGLNYRHSVEYIQSVIESYNSNKLLNPDDYKGSNVHNLIVKCGTCGNCYETSFSDYTNNMQIRCKSCSQSESIGEMKVRQCLEKHQINFVQEKRFEDCKDVKLLPFDFYLPEYNLIIEFDGQHHFKETGFKNYESTKKHDEIKNQYCINNNIGLLRIPYWQGRNIDDIISKQLNL